MLEPPLDAGHGADAATDLHGDLHRLDDVADQLGIVPAAFVNAVVVDDVQPFCAGFLKIERRLDRIDMKDEGLFMPPAGNVDALAVHKLDVGIDDHDLVPPLLRPYALKAWAVHSL